MTTPTEPTQLRYCSWLGCTESYDPFGDGPSDSWKAWPTLNLRLGPAHSAAWENGHRPTIRIADARTPAQLVCECGHTIDTAGLTNGKVTELYLLHLADEARAAAARQVFADSGVILDDTATLDGELAAIADKAAGSHADARRNGYAGSDHVPYAYAILCELLRVVAAARVALGMTATPTATDLTQGPQRGIGRQVFALDGAVHAIVAAVTETNGVEGWRELTAPMDDEQREAVADAYERYQMCVRPGVEPLRVNRWWAPAPTTT